MRKISYLSEEKTSKGTTSLTEAEKQRLRKQIAKFNEAAFRAGMAGAMVDKIASVLTKKLGIPVGITSIPELHKSSLGTFEGYFGFIGSGRALRLNFLKGKSDLLRSIDLFGSVDDLEPDTTIDLNGYNIVQVINQVVDVISGEFERYEEGFKVTKGKLQERLKVHEIVSAWLEENPPFLQQISNGSFDYAKNIGSFIDFAREKFGSKKQTIKPAALQYNVRLALENNKALGVKAVVVPGVTVKPAVQSVTLADPEAQALWEEVQKNSPKVIMDNLEEDIRAIANGDPLKPGALVYGKPGTGKTQTITQILEEEGVKPVFIDEKLTSYTKMMGVMHMYQTDKILLIDDNDSVFENEENVNLLKKLLDMKPVRRVHVKFPIKVVGTGSKEDAYWIKEDFDFDSKIIFVSNLTTINEAVLSRLAGVTHEINFSKDEMMVLIKENLSQLYADVPEITDVMRQEVFEFIESVIDVVSDMDYRAFNFCLSYRSADEKKKGSGEDWKKRSLRMLSKYKKAGVKK